MRNQILFILVISFIVSFVLTACGIGSDVAQEIEESLSAQTQEVADQEVDPVEVGSPLAEARQEELRLDYWVEEVPRLDDQGAVSVVITPINLNRAWETIDFQVKMDTHSVDLSMDLANLAMLSTDTGFTVQATRWDAPGGGHHVSGMLSFPVDDEGISILEDARKITLTLKEIDAPERIFIWER